MASRSPSPAPSSSMSVLSALGGRDGPGGGGGPNRTVMAEMPVVLQPPNHRGLVGKQKSPQEKVDRFWKKFTTEAPGKATTVIPKNKTTSKPLLRGRSNIASSSNSGSSTTTTKSYEEAAAICRAKVEKIVRECRRINQKYRDPHFDLEFDLKMNRRDCLDPLDNTRVETESSSDESVGGRRRRRHRQRSRRGRGGRGKGALVDMDGDDDALVTKRTLKGDGGEKEGKDARKKKSMPKDSDPEPPPPSPFRFTPKAVKRVCEIFDEPTFYIDGPTANDVRQGRDGDCWLMAALCTLSNKPGLIERVCVARDEAVGVYGFVFHRDGEWISEIIDDKLYLTKPDYDEVNLERIMWEDRDRVNSEETYRKTYQANSGALYFAQCENPNETWLPLLEKAYAKAHGDYSAIEGGFTGEGIEDLTGGVTSELFTTDILDKEYFWKEELMKVNEQFLFGCSTGVWGRGWGERKGIMELHAYSVMRAVEMDGQRLVMLKNPWGKGEWNGPWSDGSKEWTPEWLKKLNHRFGDDGAFWISYDDLLRKYQAFDRTRLFGPDWKVTSVWTTLSVPWTLEYHDTKFAFTLTKPGPVVLVLSQLDDRYFRGLEGQYRFELSFRLHPAGEEDYVVRSQTTYRMNRSVNVELELDPGEYHVLVKIDATRDYSIMPPEDVVRANAKENREKLIRIGLAYDVAHSKGKIVETPEEKAARVAYEKYKRDKEKKELKERIMKERQRDHYVQVKRLAKNRKVMEKRRAKQKAREEKARAEEERLMAERGPRPPPSPRPGTGRDSPDKKDEKPTDEGKPGDKKADAQVQTEDKSKEEQESQNADAPIKGTDEKAPDTEQTKADVAKEETIKDAASSVGQGEHTPTSTVSEKSVDHDADKGKTDTCLATPTQQATNAAVSTATEEAVTSTDAQGEGKEKQPESKPEATGTGGSETTKPVSNPESSTAGTQTEDTSPPKPESPSKQEGAKPEPTDGLKPGDLSQEETFHSAHQDPTSDTSSGTYTSESETDNNHNRRPMLSNNNNHPKPPPRNRPPPPSNRRPGPPGMGMGPPGYRPSGNYHPAPNNFVPRGRMPMNVRGGGPPPPPPPGGYISDNDSLSDISSPSDLSDRELEYHLENEKSRTVRVPLHPPPMGRGVVSDSEDDEFERDPWNAVAVVGFRVYYRVGGEITRESEKGKEGKKRKEEEETVQIRVIRPVWFPVENKDGEERKKKVVLEGKVKETGMDESMVLDLDDSAKDATLMAGEKGVVEHVEEEVTKENDNGVGKQGDAEKKADDMQTKDTKAEKVEAEAEGGIGVKVEVGDSKNAEAEKQEQSRKDGESEESGKQT